MFKKNLAEHRCVKSTLLVASLSTSSITFAAKAIVCFLFLPDLVTHFASAHSTLSSQNPPYQIQPPNPLPGLFFPLCFEAQLEKV
jgi:hypothetical protein